MFKEIEAASVYVVHLQQPLGISLWISFLLYVITHCNYIYLTVQSIRVVIATRPSCLLQLFMPPAGGSLSTDRQSEDFSYA